MQKLITLLTFVSFSFQLSAQELVQNIKGQVIDAQSKAPIPGVMVQLLVGDSTNITVSDVEGYYKLISVPVGRVAVLFHFI
ncbi:MAG: hypothetical protein ACJA0Q_001961 [Saprospiraceae bacterium]|jgi:hypothetical protein